MGRINFAWLKNFGMDVLFCCILPNRLGIIVEVPVNIYMNYNMHAYLYCSQDTPITTINNEHDLITHYGLSHNIKYCYLGNLYVNYWM